MRDAQPSAIYLSDYRPPAYRIRHTTLHFELFDDHALIHASLDFERDPAAPADAREQAIARMIADAETIGADAIINVRFTTAMVMQGCSEILAYGTAVRLR